MKLEQLTRIDRRIVYLMIFVGTFIPIVFTIGLPVSTTPPVQAVFDKIESLEEGDIVLMSFDYGPTTAPENAPMADAVMRHAFLKNLRVVVFALFPIGGVTMAEQELAKVAREFSDTHTYGVDYVNMGYKDGAQAAMKQLGVNLISVFPTDIRGTPTDELPIFEPYFTSGDSILNYADAALVVSTATGIIGEWWANLVNAQYGIPVAVGCTAVSAPKYYAYYKAGQMLGLLGGLKGGSEYEQLLLDAYAGDNPRLQRIYDDPKVYTAIKGMDVQTIDHMIIIAFILFGNVIFYISREREKRMEAGF
ncbi:MAG: hypothetical protein GF355_16055 [Candidatus Eisenbacteria bacterium]|nr:hypothetical protein [Candidatus Eisenbacteria bacterium]